MWSRTHTRRSTADRDRLWELLSDVDGWVHWNDGIESIALDGPLGVGATFWMTPPGEETLTSTIIELDPPARLTDRTELDGITVRVEHRLDPEPDGGTTIAFAATVDGDAPDEVLAEIGEGVTGDFDTVLAGLATAAERTGGGPVNVTVLGTGMVGQAHVARLAALGHTVTIGTRDPARTQAPAGVRVEPLADAVAGADLVINALNGAVAVGVLGRLADALAGTVLIDIANPIDFSTGELRLTVCNTDSLGEQIQRAVPAARVVKTLCTVTAEIQVDPDGLGAGEHTMFLAGDDDAAKAAALELLRAYGWRTVVDLGDLAAARGMEMMIATWLRLSQGLGTLRFNYRVVT